MLTVKEYLCASGLDIDPDKIKLVKHVDHANRSVREVIKTGFFDYYQAEQSAAMNPFHGCDFIISFLGLENNLAEFIGVYRVVGSRDFTLNDVKKAPAILDIDSLINYKGDKRIWYDLEEMPAFQALRQRIIVRWISTRGWVQKKDLEIFEILPPIKTTPFPGYQDVFIGFDELKQIADNPRAHKDWKAALEANAGIYRIVDMSTGEIYIGSAYGNEGLWGRWCGYAKTGHGGNKLLKGRDPTNFKWSVVRTLSRSMSERDVIKIEGMEKLKHGSRAHGLNGN